jgi:hypothetical protein
MQDYLDPKLIHRLLRPIERPGVINTDMGWEIVRRSQKFTNRLPLISHLTQRWNRKIGFQSDEIPIVYARSQPQRMSETATISAESSQSSTPQRTVVQAKFYPSASNLSTLTPKPFPLPGEGSQRTNSVDWIEATKPNKTSELGFPISEPNLQYLSANPAQKNPTLETSPNSQKNVVQAKFAPAVSNLSTLTPKPFPIQGEGGKTTNSVGWVEATKPNSTNIQGEGGKTTNSVGWVEATKPNSTNIQREGSQTTNLVIKPKNTRMLGFAINQPNLQVDPRLERSSSNQKTVIQAKFATASDRSILSPNPTPLITPIPIQTPPRQPSLNSNIANPSGETQALSSDFKSPDLLAETSPNFKSQIPNSIGWSGLEIPLVFSSSGVNTESAKTELAVPNPGITGISRTATMTQTTGLSSEVSPNMQSDEKSNIQPNKPDESNIQSPIDLEALTDKIERKLMQRLIVESERRGRKTWS